MRELTRAFLEAAGHSAARIAQYERSVEALRALRRSPRAPIREEYVEAPDGARIFVQSAVPAAPRALVLSQAGKECHGDLHLPLADELHARGVAFFTVDNRGHGRSGPARGAFDDASLLFPVYDALARRWPALPCHLLGESLGAALLTSWALRGGRASSLVLLVPPCRFRWERLLRPALPALRAGLAIAAALPGGGPRLRFRPAPRSSYFEAYRDFDLGDLVRAPRSTPAHLAAVLARVQRFHEEAARVTLPMLVLAAGADHDLDPAGARALASRPGRRCVVYEGAEHSLLYDRNSTAVYDEIARWVDGGWREAAAQAGA